MRNHALGHMLGCALPLLLIMILPSFGVSSNVTYFIFIILMFGCHLMMLGGHHQGHASEDSDGQPYEPKKDHHGCH